METYYKLNLTIPVLDQLLMGHDCVDYNASYLVPVVIKYVAGEQGQTFATQYRDDLPTPQNSQTELQRVISKHSNMFEVGVGAYTFGVTSGEFERTHVLFV